MITACFNSERSIERTLKSVEEQSHPNVEHILVDGGSTDETLEIIFKHRRPSLSVISEPDEGIYDAMNKGLQKASGEIICFLNADDYYVTDEVLSYVADQIQNFDLDVLLADVAFFRASSQNVQTRRYRSEWFSPERLAWGWMPAHPALFATRAVYEKFGQFDSSFKIAGDYEWIVRAFKDDTLRYKHFSQVLVNMQTGGVSTRGLSSIWTLNREVIRACRQNGVYTNWWMILSKYPRKLFEYFLD